MSVGRDLLYREATGLERAEVDVEAGRILTGLYAEAIIDNWDAERIPLRNLPFLAWAHGVLLWDDAWSEETKRAWVRDQFLFKSLRGTVEAYRMALALWGAEIVQVVAPPQGFYASPNLPREAFDAWIALMPQVRIYLGQEPGVEDADILYSDEGFADEMVAAVDTGWDHYGRKAILRHRGVDTPLRVAQRTWTFDQRPTLEFETVYLPGVSTEGLFADLDYCDDLAFADAVDVKAEVMHLRLDREYVHRTSNLHLSQVVPGFEPLNLQYDRDSDIGQAGDGMYADSGFADEHFVYPDVAALMLADRIYLYDPSVAAPMNEGLSFADFDRVGIARRTVELLVDLHTTAPPALAFVDDCYADDAFSIPEDPRPIANARAALMAAKALGDRVLVDFAPLRRVSFSDVLTEDTTLSDLVQKVI